MSFEPFVAAAVPMVSGFDMSEIRAAAAGLIQDAAAQDARLIVLPGNCDSPRLTVEKNTLNLHR